MQAQYCLLPSKGRKLAKLLPACSASMAAAPDTAIVRARGDIEDSEEEQDEVIAVDGVHTGAGRLLRAAEAAGEECHTAQHRVRPLKGQYPISTVSLSEAAGGTIAIGCS